MPSPNKFEHKGLTPFAFAMPNKYKIINNPVESYRNYYMSDEKKHLLKWSKREQPEWFIQ